MLHGRLVHLHPSNFHRTTGTKGLNEIVMWIAGRSAIRKDHLEKPVNFDNTWNEVKKKVFTKKTPISKPEPSPPLKTTGPDMSFCSSKETGLENLQRFVVCWLGSLPVEITIGSIF